MQSKHSSGLFNLIFAVLVSTLVFSLIVSACAPAPSSAPKMQQSSGIPTDHAVYRIEGTVQGDTEEMLRQLTPARASGAGGIISYSGPVMDGKTILTVKVESITANIESTETPWIKSGQGLILKCVDTKCVALRPGDNVAFLCRRQYEAMTRSADEEWDAKALETWEIDYCRLETGVVR